jgi:hypothetical protein
MYNIVIRAQEVFELKAMAKVVSFEVLQSSVAARVMSFRYWLA